MSAKQRNRKERPGADRAGRTRLHYAAAEADVLQVQQLLSAGVNPDTPDDNGWSPLHFAAQSNAADVALILLDAGAAVDSRDAHGNTPLFRAVFNSRGNGNLIAILRSRGADPYAENNQGVSPVKLALTIANYDIRLHFCDLPEKLGD